MPSIRRPRQTKLDSSEVIVQLLAEVKAAEPEIAALRKARFAISEETSIPAGPECLDEQAYRKRYAAFRMEEFQSYPTRTKDPAAAQPLAQLFFQAMADWYTIRDANQTSKILALGNAAVLAGAKDYQLEGYLVSLIPIPETPVEINAYRKRLTEAWMRVPPEDYGSALSISLVKRITKLDTITKEGVDSPPSMEREANHRELVGTMVAHLERFPKPEHWRVAQETFEDTISELPLAEQIPYRREILGSPTIVSWYKLRAATDLLMYEAWGARGSGNAGSVSEDGWKVFREKNQQMRQLTLLEWKLQPESPHAASMMIEIANIGEGEEWSTRQWFQQSVAAQCDFAGAFHYYERSLQPRWGGSHSAMGQFAEECIETGRLDTYIPIRGLDSLWAMQKEIGYERSIMANRLARNAVNAYASKVLIARKNQQTINQDSQNWVGAILNWLVKAGDYPLAKNWLENCGTEITGPDVLNSRNRLSRLKQTIAACTGPGREVAIPLVEAIYGPKIPTPAQLPKLRESMGKLREQDASELTLSLCDEIAHVLNLYDKFQTGEWVDLKFDKKMVGWQNVFADDFAVIDETTLTMKGATGAQISTVARFDPPYLIEVEVHRYDLQGQTPDGAASLLVGVSGQYSLHDNLDSVANSSYPGIGYVQYSNDYETVPFPLSSSPSRQLRMSVWPGEVDCVADGFIYSQKAIYGPLATRLGLGTDWNLKEPTACRFHGFRIRKLPYPEVIPIPAEEMDTYGQTVIDFNPDVAEGYLYKSQGFIAQGKILEAIDTLEAGIKRVPRVMGLHSSLAYLYFVEGRYSDAAQSSQTVMKWGHFSREHSILSLIESSGPNKNLQNRANLLKDSEYMRPDSYWLGAWALATAQAANGDFETAKQTIQHALTLAQDEMSKRAIQRSIDAFALGQVPDLPKKISALEKIAAPANPASSASDPATQEVKETPMKESAAPTDVAPAPDQSAAP